MKSKDIISVCISAYNAEWTLEKTLKSLENQDIGRDRFEVIIVDDGSTSDAMRKIIEKYIQRDRMNIRYFFQKNTGPGMARNRAIEQSEGKILAFTDADCICDQDWLSVIYQKIEIEGIGFIGGYTYSDDVVIFPWKMAPVGQVGITANLAVDFRIIDIPLFDLGFTGMLGDDTDFVLQMESKGFPMEIVKEMRVLHPPNILEFSRINIRARWRGNEVGLYKKHGKKVLDSFGFIFRPIIFSRISLFTIGVLLASMVTVAIWYQFGLAGVVLLGVVAFLVFEIFAYRALVIFNPDGREISHKDRIKTFFFFLLVTPLFFYYRLKGIIKFHFFLL